jgi:hypothetical protein
MSKFRPRNPGGRRNPIRRNDPASSPKPPSKFISSGEVCTRLNIKPERLKNLMVHLRLEFDHERDGIGYLNERVFEDIERAVQDRLG